VSSFDYRHPERFLGLDDESSIREESAAWVLPIPLELTTSYMGGTRGGPAAIIDASNQVELYDPTIGMEAAFAYGVHTLPTLHPPLSSAEDAFSDIYEAVRALPLENRVLVTLGGEHSITPAVVRALAEREKEIVLVQIDAHCDLRDSFDGTPYSHACATRRALPYVSQVLQFGIRSQCQEEIDFLETTSQVRVWTGEAMYRDSAKAYLNDLANMVRGKKVYLTIDLDGLDPSVVAAVGTPEPGGIGWYDCLALISTIAEHSQIFAFDCVELCPGPGAQASSFAAAKLIYKTLNYVMQGRGAFSA
jgi:agmatinase